MSYVPSAFDILEIGICHSVLDVLFEDVGELWVLEVRGTNFDVFVTKGYCWDIEVVAETTNVEGDSLTVSTSDPKFGLLEVVFGLVKVLSGHGEGSGRFGYDSLGLGVGVKG